MENKTEEITIKFSYDEYKTEEITSNKDSPDVDENKTEEITSKYIDDENIYAIIARTLYIYENTETVAYDTMENKKICFPTKIVDNGNEIRRELIKQLYLDVIELVNNWVKNPVSKWNYDNMFKTIEKYPGAFTQPCHNIDKVLSDFN